jgi:hypothetical protein
MDVRIWVNLVQGALPARASLIRFDAREALLSLKRNRKIVSHNTTVTGISARVAQFLTSSVGGLVELRGRKPHSQSSGMSVWQICLALRTTSALLRGRPVILVGSPGPYISLNL